MTFSELKLSRAQQAKSDDYSRKVFTCWSRKVVFSKPSSSGRLWSRNKLRRRSSISALITTWTSVQMSSWILNFLVLSVLYSYLLRGTLWILYWKQFETIGFVTSRQWIFMWEYYHSWDESTEICGSLLSLPK